jgi:serine protease Do
LGVLFVPIDDALYDQLPQLPRGCGVLVTKVLGDSPAEKAGLRRNDILYEYDGKKVKDCADFARRLQADKPDRSVKLTLLRGGQQTNVEASLAKGPAIRTDEESAPGVAKPFGPAPASLSLAATLLEGGRFKVAIDYYPTGPGGRLKSINCEGEPEAIQKELKEKLDQREYNLAELALKRVLMYNTAKPPVAPPEKP